MKAEIFEIFSSYQGEGLLAGQKQIFVRFSKCNLKCFYCDEKASFENGNLLTLKEAISEIQKISKLEKTKNISFTGGEPLLHSDFIKEIILNLGRDYFCLLETNGTLYEEVKKVIKFIDIVSMDIKLPYLCGLKLWDKHLKFLINSYNKVYVKVVVNSSTPVDEFKKAVNLVSKVDRKIPFFIQPESGEFLNSKNNFLSYENFYKIAALKLEDVRILPQLHKLWKIK